MQHEGSLPFSQQPVARHHPSLILRLLNIVVSPRHLLTRLPRDLSPSSQPNTFLYTAHFPLRWGNPRAVRMTF